VVVIEQELDSEGTAAGGARGLDGARVAAVILAMLAIGGFYFETIQDIVDVWFRSDTYLHGSVILPISLYLIIVRHRECPLAVGSPYWPAFIVLTGLSLAWSIFEMLAIDSGKQFVFVAMLPVTVLAIMGKEFARPIVFPLGYLLFAAPFGEFLVPALVEFTADFTVLALEMTGVPVLRQDQYLTMPAGSFEVARACSGIRYLLASVALGTIFAYLTYSSLRKRLIFLGFSIIFPILANGIRAYAIVIVAYLSDMRLAVEIDHIVFGWVFFGFVVLIMFLVGMEFRDHIDKSGESAPEHEPPAAPMSMMRGNVLSATGLIIITSAAATAGPVLTKVMDSGAASIPLGALHFPAEAYGWTGPAFGASDWQPEYRNPAQSDVATYSKDGHKIDVAIVRYIGARTDAELANAENKIADAAKWRLGTAKELRLEAGNPINAVAEIRVGNMNGKRLVWYWYDVNGSQALRPITIKILEASKILRAQPSNSSLIAVAARNETDEAMAREILAKFLEDMGGAMRSCLYSNSDTLSCVSRRPGGKEF
jgi:exosortase A